jgi:hypothetical protein
MYPQIPPDRNELELPIREVVVNRGLAGDSQNRSLGNPLWGGFGLAGCDDLE